MANFITTFRMFLALIVVAMLFFPTKNIYIIATIMTAIIIWMDGLDGYVARKFNEASKLGAVLDILSDRVVEMVYWITFCALGWLPVWVPLIVVVRGTITDGLRSIALEQGFTAFGSSTMMQSPVGKFIVASNFSRFTYAVTKALAFVLMIAGNIPAEYPHKATILMTGIVCSYISVVFCVVRGVPVVIESKRFFVKKNEQV